MAEQSRSTGSYIQAQLGNSRAKRLIASYASGHGDGSRPVAMVITRKSGISERFLMDPDSAIELAKQLTEASIEGRRRFEHESV